MKALTRTLFNYQKTFFSTPSKKTPLPVRNFRGRNLQFDMKGKSNEQGGNPVKDKKEGKKDPNAIVSEEANFLTKLLRSFIF